MRWTPLAAALVMALAQTAGGAGDTPLERATLKGLTAVSVTVDSLDSELQREGLSAQAVQSEVERGLSSAGIAVDPKAAEFVGVRITAAQAKRSDVALCVDLGLYQGVFLQRDRNIKTAVETWGAHSVLLSPARQVSQSATDTLDQLVRQFADAYRSANPK
ncbi:MAG: hypothetical protein LAQ30_17330 [Acidobacteriia bacterium]|nr:hypothetical protein [Terriglobia bacterium]